ncbi:Uncharacterized protein gop-1 [Toxocara canis]|uniref:Uncharacterized protein gop-1 n=1 Tax=Toxocara canis TaxID=6265 RepID=A0A0B2V3A4_TOXCA|nr:Uncharacterized protein gop-1 [Toxocara canis]
MFKRFGGSSTGIWKPKNPHSLEYLKYLHGILMKNERVTEHNRTLLVEALRAIAEILIWGDQNDSSVFDFFLEKQMLSYFLSIMTQKCGSYVCVQLLQTLNILFENIRHETSLYFLLSNNHVNSIITHKFDFKNEEIMAYYISFLKTLSFKLNVYTVHFFFNEPAQEFPLYTEVIKFYNHSEGMVRIAVRTTTLNIFKVEDEAMRAFVRSCSRDYLCAVVDLTALHSIDIDQFARSAENEASNRDRLTDLVGEHLDHIHYLNDIFLINPAQEFPLYTEVIKFYNHSEGMVRIAVRTTTLNIFKVEDEAMRAFVRSCSRDYLCAVVDLTALHSIDIDQFARSAENEASNRDRLTDLVGEHLDHIHYLNDIFLINDEHLSAMLFEIVFRRLLAPLYLCSLASLRMCPSAVVLTPVSSLFFLSHFLLVVTDSQVHLLAILF